MERLIEQRDSNRVFDRMVDEVQQTINRTIRLQTTELVGEPKKQHEPEMRNPKLRGWR